MAAPRKMKGENNKGEKSFSFIPTMKRYCMP